MASLYRRHFWQLKIWQENIRSLSVRQRRDKYQCQSFSNNNTFAGNTRYFSSISRPLASPRPVVISTSEDTNHTPGDGGGLIPQKKIQVNNLLINYGQIGKGPHCVLCFPGVYGTIESDFESLMLHMDHDKFTLICWEPPGYGKSRPPARKIVGNPYASDAEIAATLMKNLGHNKYSMLGWSNGGTTAAHLAAANPQSVDKFVMWGSLAFIDDYSLSLGEMMRDPKNWIPDRWKLVVGIYGETEIKRMMEDLYCYIRKCHETKSFRLELLIPAIQATTLILYGHRDTLCTPNHPQKYKELISKSKLEVWPTGEHDMHIQQEEEFISRVEKFFLTAE